MTNQNEMSDLFNYKPSRLPKFYALYSGGKDSTVTVAHLEELDMLAGVVAFDTGLSAPGWLDFVKQTCLDRKWTLEIYKTPESYEKFVLKYGFPGPGMHPSIMNLLKGRCVYQFKKVHPGSCLASGVRKQESKRRKFNVKEWSMMEGVPVYAPIFNLSTEETWKIFNEKKFERSPAYQYLCISGDCLCGAFATDGEREIIKAVYPEIDERLCKLEKQKGEGWGERSCKNKKYVRSSHPLCTDCSLREKLLV